ncbi:ras GEF [Suhomyces tanzawaensis NRRL Y-17324]|uniref:Ras GEF n=1 Tax=Suhomyces tanzawaensis NRRL Y-17324 TaxID=984487 RepID=A0A1E4SKS6_9ASCO|nr:ras GEF [Suhomyces tanzawaensis NRRL Y-17324]ODV80109.1 ras GEF [Suhomyces tanzawaensis NRRL Y-17324]
MREPTYEEEYTYLQGQHDYGNEETPKLLNPSHFNNDPLDDKTPLIEDHVFDNSVGHNLPVPTEHLGANVGGDTQKAKTSPKLPQQELSKKFQRLSMTLQQARTSGDSYQFMSSFQQNVEKANNDPTALAKRASAGKNQRTSLYYKKIHERHEGDDKLITDNESSRKPRKPSVPDQTSISTTSDISSVASQESALRREDEETKSNASSTSFEFQDTANSTLNTFTPEKSAYNIQGSRVSPWKARRAQADGDEIPVRRDLMIKGGEDERKDPFIVTPNTRANMKDKYPNGLNISVTDSLLDPKNRGESEPEPEPSFYETSESTAISSQTNKNARESTISTQDLDDETNNDELSSLFVRALHPFDSTTLQSESDASICLSFEKDDLAFVHTIDESGWGEVTLIDSLQRGWIPMNYFAIAVTSKDDFEEDYDEEDEELDTGKIPNSHYLKPLFHACSKFLMNPLSHRNRHGKYTFSIKVINSIRDGVRLLLQQTDCLSRSNEIVTKRPIVRKTRKSLLADWYNLMVKANEFKGTSNFNKIEVLTLMIYQVTRKATSFLQVWSIESKQIIKRENEKKLQNDMNNYPLLSTPPLAKQRITEINGLLFSYLGLIIGRLDLIEHNPIGCDILESMTHQIILLLRELLFISKIGSDFSSEKPSDLDGSLDTLLSLVSDLVSSVKNLVVKTLNETEEDKRIIQTPVVASSEMLETNGIHSSRPKEYYYTPEGGELIQTASKMIRSINITIAAIRKLLEITGDFKLNSERSYPDYAKMKIEPDEFIKKCSIGIAKAQAVKNRDLTGLKAHGYKSNRYSMIRSGKTGELGLTTGGISLLHDVLLNDVEGTSPFSISEPEFKQFAAHGDGGGEETNIQTQLLVDDKGNLLGASFKGLVYTLTNESSPPEYFFVSTFFICFRSFASNSDLIEELIDRFDAGNRSLKNLNKSDLSEEIRLKNRRRLISKMFQLWIESYWDHDTDYPVLTTLINFFNEGVALYLPFDAIKLIDIASRLSMKPLIEGEEQEAETSTKQAVSKKQLITRSITITRSNRKDSSSASDPTLNSRYSMVDGYELSKINTNTSTSSSLKSMTLPMPLGVGNQTSSSSSLLTKAQISTIEKVNLTYRAILGESWCPQKLITPKYYIPLELSNILPKWYNICEQSWVLSNYRPNLLDFNGLEIAKQLTLIESHIFCAFKAEELLNENFTAKRAYLKLAPNIRQSLLFTNCLSGYVLESILQPKINQKLRVNMIKTWLKIAISCLYLRNFNSLAAIITALQSHLITRLTKLWAELSDKYKELYDYLSGIIHPEKNYSIYRSKLRNFLISNDYNIPIVPYVSLFLQDLTFITEGNPRYRKANTFLNQKIINIDKYLKITRIIADIESLQIPYARGGTAKEKRSSLIFSAPKQSEVEDYNIIALPALQELIILELWKVAQLNKTEDDRTWKLSCLIQPR